MKRSILMVCALITVFSAFSVQAQDGEEKVKPFIYGTYLMCDAARVGEVDAIINGPGAAVWDQAVTDGKLMGWGWLVHNTGGAWRRVFYTVGADLEGLLTAQDEAGAKSAEFDPDNVFGQVCTSHDDYIWQQEATASGATLTENRSGFAYSTYLECRTGNEALADTLFHTFYAPEFDKQVGEGKLDSWGYLSHVIGGKYRRLLTFRAQSMSALLKGSGEGYDAVAEAHPEVMAAFGEICSSHQDYLWTNGRKATTE